MRVHSPVLRSVWLLTVAASWGIHCSPQQPPGPGNDASSTTDATMPDSVVDVGQDTAHNDVQAAHEASNTDVNRVPDGASPDVNVADAVAADAPSTPDAPTTDAATRNPGALNHKLVMYWGAVGSLTLTDVCNRHPNYDVIVIAFVSPFGTGSRDPNGLPETGFTSPGCTMMADPNAGAYLQSCPDIAAGIQTCQSQGKIVIVSIGGAVGGYAFSSDAQGTMFAQTMWDLFLGGSSPYRPFGSAVVDGVDLDIEGGGSTGYSAFVRQLRSTMDASGRRYYITGAPQCPYPDAYLGPSAGAPLGDVPEDFDAIWVQFYNNYCGYSGGSFNFSQWAGLHANGGPMVFVGLPANTSAGNGYVDPSSLPALVNSVNSDPAFGGIMMWDAWWDSMNTYGSGTYGDYAGTLVH